MRAGDDDVYFPRAGGHGTADFRDAVFKRRKSRGETGGDGGDMDVRAFEGAAGRFHETRIDADRADWRLGSCTPSLSIISCCRATRFGAEAA